MNTPRILGSLACIGLTAAVARADFVDVSPFTGQYSESFEAGGATWKTGAVPVFSGLATLREKSNSTLIFTTSWSFRTVVRPVDGSVMMGSPSAWVEYDFSAPATAFGGWFATNSGAAGGTVEFFSGGVKLAARDLNAPASGAWAWNGWSSDRSFDAVRITGAFSGGGFVMQDLLQLNVIPAPGGLLAMAGLGLTLISRRGSRA